MPDDVPVLSSHGNVVGVPTKNLMAQLLKGFKALFAHQDQSREEDRAGRHVFADTMQTLVAATASHSIASASLPTLPAFPQGQYYPTPPRSVASFPAYHETSHDRGP
jgi:hypothetical protein